MNGKAVFDLRTPVSHSHDPDTSHAAERSITVSGQRKSNNQRVAWLVARYPGLTASELTDKMLTHHWIAYCPFYEMGYDKSLIEVRRRLSDMSGIHVRRGTKDEARMGLLKNKESIWWPK